MKKNHKPVIVRSDDDVISTAKERLQKVACALSDYVYGVKPLQIEKQYGISPVALQEIRRVCKVPQHRGSKSNVNRMIEHAKASEGKNLKEYAYDNKISYNLLRQWRSKIKLGVWK